MSKVNDRILSDLKSRQNLIDKRCGEGSTKRLIDFLGSLSSLYDERIRVLLSDDLCKEEKIRRLSDIKSRIRKAEMSVVS